MEVQRSLYLKTNSATSLEVGKSINVVYTDGIRNKSTEDLKITCHFCRNGLERYSEICGRCKFEHTGDGKYITLGAVYGPNSCVGASVLQLVNKLFVENNMIGQDQQQSSSYSSNNSNNNNSDDNGSGSGGGNGNNNSSSSISSKNNNDNHSKLESDSMLQFELDVTPSLLEKADFSVDSIVSMSDNAADDSTPNSKVASSTKKYSKPPRPDELDSFISCENNLAKVSLKNNNALQFDMDC